MLLTSGRSRPLFLCEATRTSHPPPELLPVLRREITVSTLSQCGTNFSEASARMFIGRRSRTGARESRSAWRPAALSLWCLRQPIVAKQPPTGPGWAHEEEANQSAELLSELVRDEERSKGILSAIQSPRYPQKRKLGSAKQMSRHSTHERPANANAA